MTTFVALLDAPLDEFLASANVPEELKDMVREGVRVSGQSGLTPSDYLKATASVGNEDAQAVLNHLTGPRERFEQFILSEAVKIDPEWKKVSDEGGVNAVQYQPTSNAKYDTPKKLIGAYLADRMTALPSWIGVPESGQTLESEDCPLVPVQSATIKQVETFVAAKPDMDQLGLDFLKRGAEFARYEAYGPDENLFESLGFNTEPETEA